MTTMYMKVIEENHDARCAKVRRTREITGPLGEFTFPVRSMTGGTKVLPATKDDNDEESEPVPANLGSASSSSSAGPAPQPGAPEESVPREATPDVKNSGPEVKEQLPKYRAGEWIKKELFDPARLPKGYEFTEAG